MARSGLYKSDVEKARNSLIAMGKAPTVEAVRAALGSGSNTTIHKYLKQLEAEAGVPLGQRVGLSDALTDLVTRLGGGVGAVREVCDLILQAQGLGDYQPEASV